MKVNIDTDYGDSLHDLRNYLISHIAFSSFKSNRFLFANCSLKRPKEKKVRNKHNLRYGESYFMSCNCVMKINVNHNDFGAIMILLISAIGFLRGRVVRKVAALISGDLPVITLVPFGKKELQGYQKYI